MKAIITRKYRHIYKVGDEIEGEAAQAAIEAGRAEAKPKPAPRPKATKPTEPDEIK
jgi:hypothetical protein